MASRESGAMRADTTFSPVRWTLDALPALAGRFPSALFRREETQDDDLPQLCHPKVSRGSPAAPSIEVLDLVDNDCPQSFSNRRPTKRKETRRVAANYSRLPRNFVELNGIEPSAS